MKHFVSKIIQQRKQNRYRCIKKQNFNFKGINFASNDYLALSSEEKLINAAKQYLNVVGLTSSRYICGNHQLNIDVSEKIARIKNFDDALIFSSGYLTAISIIPALVDKKCLILADRLSHASLIDGAQLSGAKFLRFPHNNYQTLEDLLIKNHQKFDRILVISESVFSMDGDISDIEKLKELSKKYQCLLLIDDAHGLGILQQKNQNDYSYYLQMGTFSKACGSYGGYVCASNEIIDYLTNFSRGSIFNTSLPPSILAATLAALNIIENDQELFKKTLKNAKIFCQELNLPNPQSAIVPIIIGDEQKTIEITQELANNGFLVGAIRPPTVATGTSRLRISFNCKHHQKDIIRLANMIKKLIAPIENRGYIYK